MIKCFLLRKKIFLFADGELKKRSIQKIKKHLLKCSKCRDTLNTYVNISCNIRETLSERIANIETNGLYCPSKQKEYEKKSLPVDKIIDLISTGTGSHGVVVNPVNKLIPAILITLFILLFFATPVTGKIPLY